MRSFPRLQARFCVLSLALMLASAACSEDASQGKAPTSGDGDGDGDKTPGEGDGDDNGDGDDGPGDGDGDDVPALKPLIPWAEGNTWTYRVSKNGEVTSKVTVVGALEPVGGTGPNKDTLAYRVTTKKGSVAETVSWQNLVGDLHVRYREQSFDAETGTLKVEEHWAPHKVRVDNRAANRVSEASWLEIYDETKQGPGIQEATTEQRDLWLIDGEQTISVPAGTFKALVIRKTGAGSTKTYWYVPGIGKVKETGGQTEELEDYQVAP